MADNYFGLEPVGTPPAGTQATQFRSTESAGGQVAHVILADAAGDQLASVPISAVALPLPTGAATQTTLASVLAALQGVVSVAGRTLTPIGTLTRPADTTPYAAGDAVTTSTSAPAGLTVANAVRIAGGTGVIIGGTFAKSTDSTTNASFRIWLFDEAPTTIPNDNAPWSVPVFAERARLIATATADFASGIVGSDGVTVPITLARATPGLTAVGTSIIAIIEARAAYTPGSAEQFALTLDILAD